MTTIAGIGPLYNWDAMSPGSGVSDGDVVTDIPPVDSPTTDGDGNPVDPVSFAGNHITYHADVGNGKPGFLVTEADAFHAAGVLAGRQTDLCIFTVAVHTLAGTNSIMLSDNTGNLLIGRSNLEKANLSVGDGVPGVTGFCGMGVDYVYYDNSTLAGGYNQFDGSTSKTGSVGFSNNLFIGQIFPWDGYFCQIVIMKTADVAAGPAGSIAANLAAIKAALLAKWTDQTYGPQVHAEGDSLTQVNDGGVSWIDYVAASATPKISQWTNTALGGSTTGDPGDTDPPTHSVYSRFALMQATYSATRKVNIYAIAPCGTNDPPNAADFPRLKVLVEAVRAFGANVAVITATVPHRYHANSIDTSTDAAWNAGADAFNALLLADTSTNQYCVRLDQIPTWEDPSDTTYFVDGTHPKKANIAIAAPYYADQVSQILEDFSGLSVSSITCSPSPSTGTSTIATISASGGVGSKAYQWTVTAKPAGSTADANNFSDSSIDNPNFDADVAGAYTLSCLVTVDDETANGTVDITFTQTKTSMLVNSATVPPGGTRIITAIALDQFGNAMLSQPDFTWSVTAGASTIDEGTGFFTAALSPETATVQAASDALNATGSVFVREASRGVSHFPISKSAVMSAVQGAAIAAHSVVN